MHDGTIAFTQTGDAERTAGRRVVVVEDEEDVRSLLHHTLARAGFEILEVDNLRSAHAAIATFRPAVIVVDRMLPDGDGISLCNELTTGHDGAAVLVLSALGSESHRVEGLEAGADDYVVKPFSVRELTARVRLLAALVAERRAAQATTRSSGFLFRWRDLVVDVLRHRVLVAGVLVELRPLEFKLLAALVEHPRRIFTRGELLALLWGADACPNARTIDVHVTRLRQRLGRNADVVQTIAGYGYRLRDE